MKKKIRNLAATVAMVAAALSSGTMTAYAYTEEPEIELVIMEETPEKGEATPFSVAGNGELLDDISNDETKQFLTVQTKNGNTFFMVIDRSRETENVYMLSLVDEHDLAEFIEGEEPEAEEEKPKVILEEPKTEPAIVQTEPEPEKAGINVRALLATLLLAAGGAGGYYYIKVIKPKQEEEGAESEDLEFYDGGPYINEDWENGLEKE